MLLENCPSPLALYSVVLCNILNTKHSSSNDVLNIGERNRRRPEVVHLTDESTWKE